VDFEILEKMEGRKLEGKKYKPLFDYFVNDYPNAFRVVCDDYVTSESGTGVVHQAPAFGEDDFRVCTVNNIIEKGHDVSSMDSIILCVCRTFFCFCFCLLVCLFEVVESYLKKFSL
jgi:isoleucyl-tRNA synthetase